MSLRTFHLTSRDLLIKCWIWDSKKLQKILFKIILFLVLLVPFFSISIVFNILALFHDFKPSDWTQATTVKALSPNHWTSREFPTYILLMFHFTVETLPVKNLKKKKNLVWISWRKKSPKWINNLQVKISEILNRLSKMY